MPEDLLRLTKECVWTPIYVNHLVERVKERIQDIRRGYREIVMYGTPVEKEPIVVEKEFKEITKDLLSIATQLGIMSLCGRDIPDEEEDTLIELLEAAFKRDLDELEKKIGLFKLKYR